MGSTAKKTFASKESRDKISKILALLAVDDSTREEMAQAAGVSQSTASAYIKHLVDQKKIVRAGTRNAGKLGSIVTLYASTGGRGRRYESAKRRLNKAGIRALTTWVSGNPFLRGK
jgi:predicted ArsR family transcriptional regulator